MAPEKRYSFRDRNNSAPVRSLTDFFRDEMELEKTAADSSGSAPPPAAPQNPIAGGPPAAGAPGGMDPSAMGGMVPPGPGVPPMGSNNLRQGGMPTTCIICTSSCRYAQNEKGVCSLNKIDLTQVRDGIFQCLNFEDVGSQPQVIPPADMSEGAPGIEQQQGTGGSSMSGQLPSEAVAGAPPVLTSSEMERTGPSGKAGAEPTANGEEKSKALAAKGGKEKSGENKKSGESKKPVEAKGKSKEEKAGPIEKKKSGHVSISAGVGLGRHANTKDQGDIL